MDHKLYWLLCWSLNILLLFTVGENSIDAVAQAKRSGTCKNSRPVKLIKKSNLKKNNNRMQRIKVTKPVHALHRGPRAYVGSQNVRRKAVRPVHVHYHKHNHRHIKNNNNNRNAIGAAYAPFWGSPFWNGYIPWYIGFGYGPLGWGGYGVDYQAYYGGGAYCSPYTTPALAAMLGIGIGATASALALAAC
jgi:hypothetical protein